MNLSNKILLSVLITTSTLANATTTSSNSTGLNSNPAESELITNHNTPIYIKSTIFDNNITLSEFKYFFPNNIFELSFKNNNEIYYLQLTESNVLMVNHLIKNHKREFTIVCTINEHYCNQELVPAGASKTLVHLYNFNFLGGSSITNGIDIIYNYNSESSVNIGFNNFLNKQYLIISKYKIIIVSFQTQQNK